MKILSILSWILFAILAISIGFYPFRYLLSDGVIGLLQTKNPELLAKLFWKIAFYTHITFGGVALMVGWVQFSRKLRITRSALHRNIGKVYIIAVFLSSLAGIYAGFHATGGIVSQIGFMSLGVLWFAFSMKAFLDIRNGQIASHQRMMIYSYALCFAAVTLRLWLTPLTILMGEFISAYRIVAWLCWVPNLGVAFMINRGLRNQAAQRVRV